MRRFDKLISLERAQLGSCYVWNVQCRDLPRPTGARLFINLTISNLQVLIETSYFLKQYRAFKIGKINGVVACCKIRLFAGGEHRTSGKNVGAVTGDRSYSCN